MRPRGPALACTHPMRCRRGRVSPAVEPPNRPAEPPTRPAPPAGRLQCRRRCRRVRAGANGGCRPAARSDGRAGRTRAARGGAARSSCRSRARPVPAIACHCSMRTCMRADAQWECAHADGRHVILSPVRSRSATVVRIATSIESSPAPSCRLWLPNTPPAELPTAMKMAEETTALRMMSARLRMRARRARVSASMKCASFAARMRAYHRRTRSVTAASPPSTMPANGLSSAGACFENRE